jgi:hypothetical protein
LKFEAPQVVTPLQAQLDISSACAATLIRGLDLLHPEAAPSYNLVRVVSGSYRLLPYALEFWIEHCLLYASTGGPLDLDHLFSRHLTQLRNKHDQLSRRLDTGEIENPSPLEASQSQPDDRLKLLAHIPIHALMRGVLNARWSASQLLCENGEGKPRYRTLSTLLPCFNTSLMHKLTRVLI